MSGYPTNRELARKGVSLRNRDAKVPRKNTSIATTVLLAFALELERDLVFIAVKFRAVPSSIAAKQPRACAFRDHTSGRMPAGGRNARFSLA